MQHKDLLLKDFAPKSMLVTGEHPVQKARFPVVDFHNHLGLRGGKWAVRDVETLLDEMESCGVTRIVNLDGGWGDTLKKNIERYSERRPDRFTVFARIEWREQIDASFGENAAEQFEESVQAGAAGLKVNKALGLTQRDESGRLLRADDSRLDPIWAKAGELGVPVLIHIADPVAFFRPLDRFNERWEELQHHPNWHFYGPTFPSFEELMEQQRNLFEKHPSTLFISAHVASYSENLQFVGSLLDERPNCCVDISARIAELGRQPYAARRFFVDYQDRILFGTDVGPSPEWYRIYFRFLETADEYFSYTPGEIPGQGRWNIYGISLPDEVLEKVYHKNAEWLLSD